MLSEDYYMRDNEEDLQYWTKISGMVGNRAGKAAAYNNQYGQ